MVTVLTVSAMLGNNVTVVAPDPTKATFTSSLISLNDKGHIDYLCILYLLVTVLIPQLRMDNPPLVLFLARKCWLMRVFIAVVAHASKQDITAVFLTICSGEMPSIVTRGPLCFSNIGIEPHFLHKIVFCCSFCKI